MSKRDLRKKLLFSHVGVAISSLLTIILLVNLVMSYSFGRYEENQRQAEVNSLLQNMETSFDPSTGQWSAGALMALSHQAILRNYSVRVFDKDHNLIWDTDQMSMPMHGSLSTSTEYASVQDGQTITKAIVKDGEQIGTLEILGIERSLQSLNQPFLKQFNTFLWLALLAVIAGVYFFSVFVANSISRPLIKIKQIATRMKEGDLSSRVEISGQATEVEELGLALNHLADTLEQQDKLRKMLTADVAHELRTPLTTIQSHLEAFQDGIWEASPDKLQICHDQVMRLVQLINDLENLAAVENPMLQLRKENLCLNEVVHQALNTISGPFAYKDIQVVVKEDEKVYMNGDYARLVQVFSNLFSNAYKYTNSGSILVTLTDKGTEDQVTITDTGMGIAAEELPFIFERFYRGEKSRNRKTGGAGIGLAIVKAIVEAHEGLIFVESTVHQGTKVTVRFPRVGANLERNELL
ncbi:sensor histidine kinase [Gorillibacterium massiliense]|uniref:sensor histidine kinase n=1 Tax=Gorillibacterium massiliense TaxID=1280390 RepID=UPI0004BBDC87|nr:HAMP domain-containing sensor histidine kinase [Gorillibacterium massiliense]